MPKSVADVLSKVKTSCDNDTLLFCFENKEGVLTIEKLFIRRGTLLFLHELIMKNFTGQLFQRFLLEFISMIHLNVIQLMKMEIITDT